jgi:hypothetical protein
MDLPPALLFDVFGTCVDWRRGVTREGRALRDRLGLGQVDWAALAEAWTTPSSRWRGTAWTRGRTPPRASSGSGASSAGARLARAAASAW